MMQKAYLTILAVFSVLAFSYNTAIAGEDLGVVSIDSISSACGLTANEQLAITIQNGGDNAQAAFNVGCLIQGPIGDTVIENVGAFSVLPGATQTYNFTLGADFSAQGAYTVTCFVFLLGDSFNTNDTLTTTITHLALAGGVTASAARDTICALDTTQLFASDIIDTILFQPWETLPNANPNSMGWSNSRGTLAPDWTVDNAGTGSGGTGPRLDHTFGTTAGKYVYLETSSGAGIDTLSGPPTLINANNPKLSFWYHMFGTAMGTLECQIFDGTNLNLEFTISGQQHLTDSDPWTEVIVDLTPYIGQTITLQFVGIRGTSFTSDMAVDDIMIYDVPLYTWTPAAFVNIDTIQNPIAMPTMTTDYIVEANLSGCIAFDTVTVVALPVPAQPTGFDSIRCGVGTVTLTGVGSGGTLIWYDDLCDSVGTGNSYTTDIISSTTTYYVSEILAGCPGPKDTVQAIVTPPIPITASSDTVSCSGETIPLSVSSANTSYTYVWTETTGGGLVTTIGANVTAVPTQNATYLVTATDTMGCADTATVNVGVFMPANLTTTAAPDTICAGDSSQLCVIAADTTPSGLSSNILFEDFEAFPLFANPNTGGWFNTRGTLAPDWTVDENGTGSGGTGPDVDHTFGTIAGNFIYLETSSGAGIDTLKSPILNLTTAGTSLSFWYHMFGGNMGTLEAGICDESGTYHRLWSATGQQHPTGAAPWSFQSVDISAFVKQDIRLCFVGVRGTGFTSDMALDDISVDGFPGPTVSWSPAATLTNSTIVDPLAFPTIPTMYTVTSTTNAGCVSVDSILVHVRTPGPAPVGIDTATCGPAPAHLVATGAGGTMVWFDANGDSVGTGSPFVTDPVFSNTTFTVEERGLALCPSARDTVNVTVGPSDTIMIFSTDSQFCDSGMAMIYVTSTNPNYMYSWTQAVGGGISDTVGDTVMVNPTAVGNYVYTVTGIDTSTGCSYITSTRITVYLKPEIIASTDKDTICLGDSAQLDAIFAPSSLSTRFLEDWESYAPFGRANVGGWNNINAADPDWTLDENGTTSFGTGPELDHTTGTNLGNYVYLETSGGFNGAADTLTSPPINILNGNYDLSFWYHMFGDATMGTLEAYVTTGGVATQVFAISGQQHAADISPWTEVVVDLSPYAGSIIQLQFVGIDSTGFASDMALDDIWVFETPVGSTVWTPSATLSNDTINSPVATPIVTTTYTAIFTADNGCADTSTVEVAVVLPAPQPVTTTDTICDTGTAMLTATTTGGTIVWLDENENQIGTGSPFMVFVDTNSVFYVAEDNGHCLGAYDTVNVVVYDRSLVDLGPDSLHCYADSVWLDAGNTIPSATYLWSTGATTQMILTDAMITQYWVDITFATGCTLRDSVNIDRRPEIVWSLDSTEHVICFGDSTGAIHLSASSDSVVLVNRSQLNGGAPDNTIGTGGNYTNFPDGLRFDALQEFTLLSVEVYPNAAGNVVIQLLDNTNTLIQTSAPFAVTAPGPVTVPVNFTIPAGTGWQINANGTTTGGLFRNNTGAAYPYSIPGVLNITSAINNLAAFYYFFYNWSVEFEVDTTVANEFDYLWSNGDTTQDISGLPAGSYDVVISDRVGCSVDTMSITITQNDSLGIALDTIINNNCADTAGEVQITVTGGVMPYAYLWNTGDTTQDLDSLIAGNYTVTVTDSVGCTATMTYTVTEPTSLSVVVDSTQNVDCNGDSTGTIWVTVSSGFAPYSYSWSNGDTTLNLMMAPAGNYTLTVSDALGCNGITPLTPITENPVIVITIDTVINTACNGDSNGSILITTTGGVGPHTYAWSNGATTEDAIGLPAGNYNVTVTDSLGCAVDSMGITVTEPAVLVVTLDTIIQIECNGANDGIIQVSTTGGTMPYTYVWSTGGASDSIGGLAPGLHSLTVTDNNGCTDTLSAIVTEPTAIVVAYDSIVDRICDEDSATGYVRAAATGGTGSYTYLWNNGDTTQAIANLDAGFYQVTVTDSNGCMQTLPGITIIKKAPVSIFAGTDKTVCIGDSVKIGELLGIAPPVPVHGYDAISGRVLNWPLSSAAAPNVTALAVPEQMFAADFVGDLGLYALDNAAGTLVRVDTATGARTLIGPCPSFGGQTWTGLAWDRTTDILYGASTDGVTSNLYQIDVHTGNNFVINPISIPLSIWIAIDNAGMMYTADIGTDMMYSVNNVTGVATVIGAMGFDANFAQDADFDPSTNTLYLSAYNGALGIGEWRIADVTTGNTTYISDIDVINSEVTGMGIAGTTDYTYQWSPSASLTSDTAVCPLAFPTTDTEYIIMVTDEDGCVGYDTVNVDVNDIQAPLDTIIHVSCFGDSTGQIIIDAATGGYAPYTYAWSNGDTTQNLMDVPMGTYSVTITDTFGCVIVSPMYVVNENPQITMVVDSIINVFCASDTTGAIYISDTGGVPPYTYSWSNGKTTQDAINIGADTAHTVTITDALGCEATFGPFTVTENPPVVFVYDSIKDVTCNSGSDGGIWISISGGVGTLSSFTYMWSSGNMTQDVPTGLAAGTYTVTVTDSLGCQFVSVPITIDEPLVPLTVSIDSIIDASCVGSASNDGAVYISVSGGTGPYTYAWSNTETSQDITNLSPGNYFVTVTDIKGCIFITPALTVGGLGMPPMVNLGPDMEVCGSITLDAGAGPGVTYLWNTGATTQTINVSTSGLYWVEVSNACGNAIDAITIDINQAPVAGFGYWSLDKTVSFTDLSAPSSGNTYFWDFNDGATNTTANPVHTYSGGGSYNVCLTVTNNCGTDTYCDAAIVIPLSLDDLFGEGNSFLAYPNPADQAVTVELTGDYDGKLDIQLVDMLGQIVSSEALENIQGSHTSTFDVSTLAEGIYHIRLTNGDVEISKKIVVMHN